MNPTQNIGRRFPSEKTCFVDRQTGRTITALTNSTYSDAKIYQDHPQWSHDGRWIVFRSNRAAADGKTMQAFAVDELTGIIVQLSDYPGLNAGTLNVSRLSGKLWYLRQIDGRTCLMELDMARVLADSAAGTMSDAADYERHIFTLEKEFREAGGFAVDALETHFYLGSRRLTAEELRGETLPPNQPGQPMRQHPSRLWRIELADGSARSVADVEFLMGHVQTNPWVSGEVVFCQETGGDTLQRMYIVSDGSPWKPLYLETPEEWVTHEAIVTKDEVMFAIMGHLDRLRLKPHGLAVINVRTNEMSILGQCQGGQGFWHVNGSPDGRWAVADDFIGRVHLIDRRNGQQTILTGGHVMKPDHAHPTFDPSSRRILFQSGLLSDGKTLSLMTVAVPD